MKPCPELYLNDEARYEMQQRVYAGLAVFVVLTAIVLVQLLGALR